MRAPLLTNLYMYNVIDYKYNVEQQISELLLYLALTETLCLLISTPHFFFPPPPSLAITIPLSDNFRYLIWEIMQYSSFYNWLISL